MNLNNKILLILFIVAIVLVILKLSVGPFKGMSSSLNSVDLSDIDLTFCWFDQLSFWLVQNDFQL